MTAGARHLVAATCLGLLLLLGCGDIWLEGPDRLPPDPACNPGDVLDPDSGWCVPAACQSDDQCDSELRCDLVSGRCVRKLSCEEIGEPCPDPP